MTVAHEPVLFLILDWEDGCTVYDRRYGDTHALNGLTAALFRLLQAAPDSGLASLCMQLATVFPALTGSELADAVELAHQQLVSCRLIQG